MVVFNFTIKSTRVSNFPVKKLLATALFFTLATSATAGDFSLKNRSEAFTYGFLSSFETICRNVIISALPNKIEYYSSNLFMETYRGSSLFSTYSNGIYDRRSNVNKLWLLSKSDAERNYIHCKEVLEGHPNLGRWFRMKPNK